MATISDQLAADIRTAFACYEVDTGNQTQYRAGYPFNWSWVSANTFSGTTYH